MSGLLHKLYGPKATRSTGEKATALLVGAFLYPLKGAAAASLLSKTERAVLQSLRAQYDRNAEASPGLRHGDQNDPGQTVQDIVSNLANTNAVISQKRVAKAVEVLVKLGFATRDPQGSVRITSEGFHRSEVIPPTGPGSGLMARIASATESFFRFGRVELWFVKPPKSSTQLGGPGVGSGASQTAPSSTGSTGRQFGGTPVPVTGPAPTSGPSVTPSSGSAGITAMPLPGPGL